MKDFQHFLFQMVTLFTKHVDSDILIVQIYVDIIFGSTNEKLCKDFESCM